MKNKLKIAAVFTMMVMLLLFSISKCTELRHIHDIDQNNIKTLSEELVRTDDEIRILQLTKDQMQYLNDSISVRVRQLQDSLKIKQKNIVQYVYQKTIIEKVDTIHLTDTIFRDSVNLDWCVSDRWYRCCVHVEYPDIITVNPTFTNEMYIIYNIKKEIASPSKSRFINMFKRKNKVLYVDIVNESPYVENEKQRFVNVIK